MKDLHNINAKREVTRNDHTEMVSQLRDNGTVYFNYTYLKLNRLNQQFVFPLNISLLK